MDFIVGALAGAMLITCIWTLTTISDKELINQAESAIELCQADLPRSQKCELTGRVINGE